MNTGILVTGPHRSGTSALAGALIAAGSFAGGDDDLIGRTFSNAAGHFERIDFVQANDALLSDLGATWDRPVPTRPADDIERAVAQAHLRYAAVLQTLEESTPFYAKHWLLKDPRVCVLPIAALEPLYEAHLVGIVRAPLEVAQSLRSRDQMSLPSGLTLWEQHIEGLLRIAPRFRRSSIVLHAELMSDPVTTLEALFDQIDGLEPRDAPMAAATIISTLWHERTITSDGAQLSERQTALWERLRSGEFGTANIVTAPVRRRQSAHRPHPHTPDHAGPVSDPLGRAQRDVERLVQDLLAARAEVVTSNLQATMQRDAVHRYEHEASQAAARESLLQAELDRRLVRLARRASLWAAPWFRWWRSRLGVRPGADQVAWFLQGIWTAYRILIPLRFRLLIPRAFRRAAETRLLHAGVADMRTAPQAASLPATAASHPAGVPASIATLEAALPSPVLGSWSEPTPGARAVSTPVLATYFPQYHVIPENERWWGKGFTDWHKVLAATPRFSGHDQPHRPGPLGNYDLTDASVVRKQSALAREAGVDGFMVYSYRFEGRALLEQPLHLLANDSVSDRLFFACWANENWTRRWDGLEEDVLLRADNSQNGIIEAWRAVLPLTASRRYLRLHGRPLFGIYRPSLLEDGWWEAFQKFLDENDGGRPLLALIDEPAPLLRPDTEDLHARLAEQGDALRVGFPPHSPTPRPASAADIPSDAGPQDHYFSYLSLIDQPRPEDLHRSAFAPGVTPGWDNTARRAAGASILLGATPSRYRRWLHHALTFEGEGGWRPPFILVNGWNEWAESAYLEPDATNGFARLHATRDAVVRAAARAARATGPIQTAVTETAVIAHAFYPELLGEMLDAADGLRQAPWFVTTRCDDAAIDRCRDELERRGIEYQLRPVVNRGRDVWPFILVVPEVAALGFSRFVKVHTKRSPHRIDGGHWRRQLLNDVFLVDRSEDSGIFGHGAGMIIPRRHALDVLANVGSNMDAMRSLMGQIRNPLEIPVGTRFAAGSMFIGDPQAFAEVIDALGLWSDDFPSEQGQVDGTLAHALERSWPLLLSLIGRTTVLR
jgi:lipopolysaccharide biosynthesis protein